MSLRFEVNDRQQEEAYAFFRDHECSIRGKYQGAIGGAHSWVFISTTIGLICNVECSCGASACITDVDEV